MSDGAGIDNPRWSGDWLTCGAASANSPGGSGEASAAAKPACWLPKPTARSGNQRDALHHDVSRWLVERYGVMAMEDLKVKGL